MTFTHALSTNNYGPAKFIVDSSAANGTHTTIASALTSASSGDTIFIRTGTYTENLTLKAGVNLTAFGSDSSQNATGKVIISGTCTMTTAGTVTIAGIQLQTNSAAFLAVTGSAASAVNLQNCYLNCTNNTGITFSSSDAGAAINLKNCTGNLGTTGIMFFAHSSAGNLFFTDTNINNSGASTTASTVSAGNVSAFFSSLIFPITSSGTGGISVYHCIFELSSLNTTVLTYGGSGSSNCVSCHVGSGTASALSVSTVLGIHNCTVGSSNTNAITGAGTINYSGLVFTGTSSTINVTTQTTAGTLQGSKNTGPTAGFLGQQISGTGSGVNLPNATATNISSIALTPGIWDVSIVCLLAFSGVQSLAIAGISATSATITGTAGQQYAQSTGPFTANSMTFSVPQFRVTLTSNTTYYLVAQGNFSSGNCIGAGRISATRVG